MKMNEINEAQLYGRVLSAINGLLMSTAGFAEGINIQYRTFHGYLNEKRQHKLWPLLPKILEAYPMISRQWLYFGEGPRFIGLTAFGKNKKEIPLREIAQAVEQMASEAGGTARKLYAYVAGIPIDRVAKINLSYQENERNEHEDTSRSNLELELEEIRKELEQTKEHLRDKEKIIQLLERQTEKADVFPNALPAPTPPGAPAASGENSEE